MRRVSRLRHYASRTSLAPFDTPLRWRGDVVQTFKFVGRRRMRTQGPLVEAGWQREVDHIHNATGRAKRMVRKKTIVQLTRPNWDAYM